MGQLMNLSVLSTVSEVELAYKSKVKASERPQVTNSCDCYNLLKLTWDEIEFAEQFNVILMNRANRVLGIYEVLTGGVIGTVPDPKLIFTAALKMHHFIICIAHSHPSGNLKPSRADGDLALKIRDAGKAIRYSVVRPNHY